MQANCKTRHTDKDVGRLDVPAADVYVTHNILWLLESLCNNCVNRQDLHQVGTSTTQSVGGLCVPGGGAFSCGTGDHVKHAGCNRCWQHLKHS
jgi:hypothetical protein